MPPTSGLFPGFRHVTVAVDAAADIHAVVGPERPGRPALLLLHGYPQTCAMWHRVAPRFAERFNVVAADLRGYGDSGKPISTADHATYSKRAMAADQVRLMQSLGHERFLLAGHDRGGRVAHRLAVDHPQAVMRIAVLDIAPTLAMYEKTTEAFARAYWHWFFLIRPAPVPERMIGADVKLFLRAKMGEGSAGMKPFSPEAWAEYERCFTPGAIHASCEDYRAAASIDLEHDRADRDAGLGIGAPLLALWGRHGIIERCFAPLDEWRRVAGDVRGKALEAGHYLAEEAPERVIEELETFFN
ncbi:MAG TPA: alpha/beta hydrolase [Usitatibacter sp.]|nr:alpha/beta hydrolase [Usitatibacter sp.]